MLPLRVVLAEDHPLMREAIAALLSVHCSVVAALERGDAVYTALQEHHTDALVLDVSMPGLNGLQVLEKVRSEFPHLAILVLSSHDPRQYEEAAFARGADGFVQKQNAAKQLWPSLEAAVLSRQQARTGTPAIASTH